MSIRWMAVQFVGDTLRLPIVSKPDMDKPFGSSELEREVRRIVVNPFSDNPQTFVPEAENAKLRELVRWMYDRMDESCAVQYPYAPAPISYDRLMQAQARACELGIEVE